MRNDDIIVCDEDDLRAVLSQKQRQDNEIIVCEEQDLLDVINGF